jgi:hypothetical protein
VYYEISMLRCQTRPPISSLTPTKNRPSRRSFAEGCRERRAIWEQGLETFKREIEKEEAGGKSGGDGGGKMRSDSEVSVDI